MDAVPADGNLGMSYAVQLTDGSLITVLDFNMGLLDQAQTSLKDGSGICSLPGFDGAMGTFGGPMGQGKGITAPAHGHGSGMSFSSTPRRKPPSRTVFSILASYAIPDCTRSRWTCKPSPTPDFTRITS